MKTAILVDGGFYRKRAYVLWGDKAPSNRADELFKYCTKHISIQNKKNKEDFCGLYRIFYYDCDPIDKEVYHPLLKTAVNLKKKDTYQWSLDFFDELRKKRKVALRKGELSKSSAEYALKSKALKQLFKGELKLEEIKESDFIFKASQKGVDMRIGLDIASLAYKKQVDQIILISGDSDFVAAAKLARREGIDFILDPMWADIKPNLSEHVDGIMSAGDKDKDPAKKATEK